MNLSVYWASVIVTLSLWLQLRAIMVYHLFVIPSLSSCLRYPLGSLCNINCTLCLMADLTAVRIIRANLQEHFYVFTFSHDLHVSPSAHIDGNIEKHFAALQAAALEKPISKSSQLWELQRNAIKIRLAPMQILFAGLVAVDGNRRTGHERTGGEHLLINAWLAKARKCNNIFRLVCVDNFCWPAFRRLQIGYCLAPRSCSSCCCCCYYSYCRCWICWGIIKNQLARILLFLQSTLRRPLGAAKQPKYKMATQQSPHKLSPGWRPLMSPLFFFFFLSSWLCLQLEHLFIIIIGPICAFISLRVRLRLWVVYGNRFSANIFSFLSV